MKMMTLLAASAVTLALTGSVLAQESATPVRAGANSAPSARANPADQRRYMAALRASVRLPEFNAAEAAGDAVRAKAILVANGASPSIRLALAHITFNDSDPSPADTPNNPDLTGCEWRSTFIPGPPPRYQIWKICFGGDPRNVNVIFY